MIDVESVLSFPLDFYSIGPYKQDEKTTPRMEENICKMKQLTKDESPKYISSSCSSLSKNKQPNQKGGGGWRPKNKHFSKKDI